MNIYTSVLLFVPAKLFNVIICVLIELADPAVDVLRDALTTRFLDGLLDRLSQQHVLI